MLFAKRFEDLTWTDIEDLVASGAAEDRNLDYKRELPNLTKDPKSFLTDIAAFANGGGGVLVYGVEEDRYVPLLLDAGASYPVAVVVSIVGARGLPAMPLQKGMHPRGALPLDAYSSVDVVIDGDEGDLKRAMKAVFDSLWQGFGYDRSPSYGTDGSWTRERPRL